MDKDEKVMSLILSRIINWLTVVLSAGQRIIKTYMLKSRVIIKTGNIKHIKLGSKFKLTITASSTKSVLLKSPPKKRLDNWLISALRSN